MKKILYSTLLIASIFGIVSIASAENAPFFNISLKSGSTNKVEVLKLQSFLASQGFLNVTPSGLFLSLTKQAVIDFQKANNVSPASGYFGPLTIAKANQIVIGINGASSGATISIESVTNSASNNATVLLSNSKTITWKSGNYPANAGVNINLLRKVRSYPDSYTLVRTIATNTVNDGQETWTPQSGETTNDLYIQVTCSTTYKYPSGCNVSGLVKVSN